MTAPEDAPQPLWTPPPRPPVGPSEVELIGLALGVVGLLAAVPCLAWVGWLLFGG